MNASVRLKPHVTVLDVMRDMGVEPSPRVSWAIGTRVRDEYQMLFDALPPKALRPKTSGTGGTHCLAVYGPEMRPTIERIVREHSVAAARQADLFGEASHAG
jgi:hypothetical protein